MRLAVLLAGLLLLSTGVALADDRSLREAGRSKDAQFETLGERHRNAVAYWRNSGHSEAGARRIARISRRVRGLLGVVEAAARAEQPSSRYGVRYKKFLLLSLDESGPHGAGTCAECGRTRAAGSSGRAGLGSARRSS